MIEDLKKSWILTIAKTKFVLGGQKDLSRFDVPYGAFGAASSLTLTEQVIGGARVSIFSVAGGYLYQVDNTMGRYSYHLHINKDIPRKPNQVTPKGNTYHRFIWFER